ncbi:MAG: ABC transporter ATP-binding protein [Clostridia bacterium]|nr:ABC transporter ATP-binding protein [Clostridia bacterium]
MIEIADLSFSYGKNACLKQISLQFQNGELTAVVGANGSGKSTLLKLIAGELAPQNGRVCVDGNDIRRTQRMTLAKSLSYFPQDRPTPDFRAEEVVGLGRYAQTHGRWHVSETERQIVAAALQEVGAAEFSERNLQTLSLGQRQKVYLAMLLAQDASNCLLDEPTNFLDVAASFATLQTLKAQAERGRCVVCVLHDLPVALAYADRVVVMRDGTIFADGTPDELCADGSLEAAFDVRITAVETDGKRAYLVMPK